MNRHSGVFSVSLMILLLLLQGCGGGGSGGGDSGSGGGNENVGTTTDTDGDGLSDYDEKNIYHTSYLKKDTDGDGISDFDEIVTYSFNSKLNNFQYNPLIADVPNIDIEIQTAPDISLNYEYTDSSGNSATSTVGTSHTTGVTTTKSNSNSNAIEAASTQGQELSLGVEVSIGFDPSLSLSVNSTTSSSYTSTTSSEQTFSWSNEQSSENSNTYESAKAFESSHSVAASAGTIATAVKVKNAGKRTFTLTNLTLSASMLGSGGAILSPINNLNIDNVLQEFPQTSLAANSSTGTLIFAAPSVSAATTKSLLSSSKGMNIGVASYELVDVNGVAFAFAQEQVNASTATVIIDYDFGGAQQKYFVSTVADPTTLTVTAKDVMEKILKLPYTTETSGQLLSIKDTTGNTQANSWLVMHKTGDGQTQSATIYKHDTNYDFNSLTLKAGDVLHMVFQVDTDGDGLGRRLEAMLGTDENNSDTDGDGINDFDEMFTGWQVTYPGGTKLWVSSSPTKADTDGDGLTDLQEMQKLTDPRNQDTDGDYLIDSQDPNPLVFDTQLYAQALKATFTDVDSTTGNATINWGHVWSGAVKTGRDLILFQSSGDAGYGQPLSQIAPSPTQLYTSFGGPFGTWWSCGSTTLCWHVLGAQATSSSDGISTYSFTKTGLPRASTYKFAVVSEYTDGANYYYVHNGAGSIVDAASAGTMKRVTITMNLVSLAAGCLDSVNDNGDGYKIEYGDCEAYYTAVFNGKTIASRFSNEWLPETHVRYTIKGVVSGSLNPVEVLWTNPGTNQWVDTSNPDPNQLTGTATWYVDVIDTTTSVPITFTVGERDAGEPHDPWEDGLDERATQVVNVNTNNLVMGTNQTAGTTVSWLPTVWGETGSMHFNYTVTVGPVP